ncbi:MAG: hypothetical protein N2595_07015 [bacterium]|nr:hypothetical protein [bacterium]
MKRRYARRWWLFLIGAGSACVGGCGRPSPDAVVRACLEAAAAQRYERALSYCGPTLHTQYSNHLWLTQLRRQLGAELAFTVEPPENMTCSTAHVRVQLEITMRNEPRNLNVPVRADLAWRDKWYIETVWLLGPDGHPRGQVFDHVHDPIWW